MKLLSPIEGVSNPEDLVLLDGTSWVVTSGMKSPDRPGSLYLVDRTNPVCATPLSWRDGAPVLAPHGLSVRRRDDGLFDLLAVDHHNGESILHLTLAISDDGPEVVACERIAMPAGTSGNAVTFQAAGGFLATSFFDPNDVRLFDHFARADPTGHIWHHVDGDGWSQFTPEGFSGANGIVEDADGLIFICEWAASKVWKLDADGRRLGSVTLDFLPDNVRLDGSTLLVAGQRATTSQVHDCKNRGTACPRPYSVVRIDPTTLDVALIFAGGDDAAEAFALATGALAVGDEIWLGSSIGTLIGRLGPD